MKRFISILLLLALLTGCAQRQGPTAPATTTAEPEIPSSSWYEQGSALETQTNGTLRLFRGGSAPVTEIASIGDKLLLISRQDKTTELTVLHGKTGEPLASCKLGENVVGLQPIYNAVAYYDSATNETVCLDRQLQEIGRIEMPEDMEGTPVFAPNGSEIYYCVGQEIRAYDTSRNITRPIRTHTCEKQTLTGVFFNGDLLSCDLELADGSVKQVFVSSQTGQPMAETNHIDALSTFDNSYIAMRMDGIVRQLIFGTLESDPQNLNVPQGIVAEPAASLGGVVGTHLDENGTLQLSFYELSSGKRTAALSVSGVGAPLDLHPDEKNQCIWLLSQDPATQEQIICRWDYLQDSVEEESSCITPVYTKTNLDETGINACNQRADSLDAAHGIDIRIWEKAVSRTGGYTLEAEYQTEANNAVLGELETVLAEYPDMFLYKSVNRLLRIGIVRSIDGECKGVQFWQNSECYILLSAGCNVREEFAKAMGYVVNSRVLGNSPLFDDWASLNPEGFTYGETDDESLLRGETKAFADIESMASVTEDRSRLFRYAVTAGNAEMFASSAMQAKLRQLCLGIRDAWRWEEKKDIYPWEQYLTEPLAHQ